MCLSTGHFLLLNLLLFHRSTIGLLTLLFSPPPPPSPPSFVLSSPHGDLLLLGLLKTRHATAGPMHSTAFESKDHLE
jgi:hypothetical protein